MVERTCMTAGRWKSRAGAGDAGSCAAGPSLLDWDLTKRGLAWYKGPVELLPCRLAGGVMGDELRCVILGLCRRESRCLEGCYSSRENRELRLHVVWLWWWPACRCKLAGDASGQPCLAGEEKRLGAGWWASRGRDQRRSRLDWACSAGVVGQLLLGLYIRLCWTC